MKRYESWGRYPKTAPVAVMPIYWRSALPSLATSSHTVLPFGQGRSYGDSCLNDRGVLLDTGALSRFIAFDDERGLLRCEAGATLAEILRITLPRGWFLPVTPGTKFVSLGGAIANDVHGKNHHRAGTFGRHVTSFQLLRSSGEILTCSPSENADFFDATVAGLGLTGLVLSAEVQLKRVSGPLIDMERIRFTNLEEFFELATSSDRDYEYTVAWVDCLARGRNLGRGIFMRANHAQAETNPSTARKRRRAIRLPCDLPAWLLNPLTLGLFNAAYYRAQEETRTRQVVDYEPFFYPLDSIREWNRMYGRRGFFQYQCVVPIESDHRAIEEILAIIARAGEGSFLAVLKTFGSVPSPGMLSFPRPGVTLALDFANRGTGTLRLLETLDGVVRASGGAVYPAKDARMSAESFQAYFPRWQEFARFIDPRFSSSFWRRVTAPPMVQSA